MTNLLFAKFRIFNTMDSNEDFKGFYQENKALVKEYIDLRMKLLRLQGIRMASKGLALLGLILILAVLFLFVLIFLGLSLSGWLAAITGSVVIGHLLTSGIYLIFMSLVIVFRKSLLLNPLIRLFIGTADEEKKNED